MNKFIKSNFSFITLFDRIGGFRLACESVGGYCVFASEEDLYAQKTYQINFGDTPHGDICKINEYQIPSHDLLCAGLPCQSFLIAGKTRSVPLQRGNMFWQILRMITYHNPKVVLLESLRSILSHDRGQTIRVIRHQLQLAGYKVHEALLNAGDFGVPQQRQRVYLVCIRKDLSARFIFPLPLPNSVILNDVLQSTDSGSHIKKHAIYRSDFQFDPKKVNALSTNCEKRPIRIGFWNKGCQAERIYSPYGHAVALTAHGGGGGARTGTYLINGVVRKLTPRECARLQGFPDNFQIPVSDSQAYKQFGSSVTVPVVAAILQSLCCVLAEVH